MEQLYSKTHSGFLLGSLLNNTNLLYETKYALDKEDFKPFAVHEILFVCICQLADRGAESIDAKEIAEFLKAYPSQEEKLEKEMSNGDYIGYIDTLKQLDNDKAYDYYYGEVRKRSLLRHYRDNGFPIEKFYDCNGDETEQNARLNAVTIQEILDYFDSIQVDLKFKYRRLNNEKQYKAGDNFAETKEQLKIAPQLGASFMSPCLNEIYRGMYGLVVRGAKSGDGKTTESIADCCMVGAKEMWSFTHNAFVPNPSREGNVMFINTEMTLADLDIMLVACISGVERRHIKDGKYLDGEEERVDRAGEILRSSGIYVVDMPEFTCGSLVERIKEYKTKYDIKVVVFDYIQNNGWVAKELANEQKIPMREDMVINTITDRLKQVQRECEVSMLSSCQTNGREDEMEIPTESCLAGSKGQVRKLDGCMLMLPPKKAEQKVIDAWVENQKHKVGFQEVQRPNRVIHIIKGRNSSYEKHIKLYQYVDYGTCRYYDMFATTKDNEPINIDRLYIGGNFEE
jgi:replicative DNA helicase